MPRAILGTIVACAASFLVGADGLALAIALPALRDDLGAAPVDAQWVLTAYGLTFGGGLLLGGRLGDLYGRRRMLIAGMAVFAAGAVLGALAPSLPVLIAARAIQGTGAAAAMPAALALIGSLFEPGPARTRALGVLAATASVGIMTGLLLGGLVTQELGWRWVFGVMVAPAVLAAVAAPFAMPEARAEESPRPDVVGAALATAGMVLVIFGFTRLEHDNVPLAAAGVLAGAAVLAGFVAWEYRTPAPLVRFGVLTIPSLRAATLGVAVNSIAFTAIVFVGTLYLQDELGYGPLEAGLALLPLDLVAFIVSVGVAHRIRRAALPAAFVVTAAALAWLARAPSPMNYAVDLLVPLVVLGMSVAVAYVALTNEAIADVEPDEKGLASGIFETANHLFGAAVGVAVYATVIAEASYGAAFGVAAALALLGVVATRRPRAVTSPNVSATKERLTWQAKRR